MILLTVFTILFSCCFFHRPCSSQTRSDAVGQYALNGGPVEGGKMNRGETCFSESPEGVEPRLCSFDDCCKQFRGVKINHISVSKLSSNSLVEKVEKEAHVNVT